MNLNRTFGLAIFATAILTAVGCGGGGGGTSPTPSVSSTTPSSGGTTPTPTPTPTASTGSGNVAGIVVQVPSDAYGPAVINGITYQNDLTSTAPLVGATVIIGPVPIVGATPPATLPAGDVSTTTNGSGAFAATLTVSPAAASSAEPFVVPPSNLTNFTAPATGYYVEVFGVGTDGLSASVPIPLHRFVAASTSIALHVSTATVAEAGALSAVNTDRASNGAGALIFDESAQEAARLHASDMATQGYTCHYDTHNIGPASRYLQVGGIGLTGESAADVIAAISATAFQVADGGFMAEKTLNPPGGHYLNNVDVAHLWAGLGAVASVVFGGNYVVDYELVTPNALDLVAGAAGYPVTSGCPAGTVVNQS